MSEPTTPSRHDAVFIDGEERIPAGSLRTEAKSLKERWRAFKAGLNEYYYAAYRSTMARAAREEDDFFMLVVLGEALGIPNPMAYETAELWPYLREDFHEWHTRLGLEDSPFDHFSCCC
ncbi:cory-CC-star protein [Bowdeniella nasicola]|uniref:cory-CC-star protein n=1 Tax=Bowdeniella nasicola TaxID=208480 RepID=UPI001C9E23AF|nr:cory-CC-star protein [Bowdeniella nasicola]